MLLRDEVSTGSGSDRVSMHATVKLSEHNPVATAPGTDCSIVVDEHDWARLLTLSDLNMKPLKIGITGVRGIVGETFTPEVAVGFAQAFGTYLDSARILVGRDTRLSGPMVRSGVVAGLLAAGFEGIHLGSCA